MRLLLKRICAVFILTACLLNLGGCFDRRELDTLGIVIGIGLDKGKDEGDTVLTIQMANPAGGQASDSKSKGKSSKGGGESGGGSKSYINVSNEGKNINYIVREMQHKMSRRIYVAHSEVIVLSEELAKNGVRDSLDFFARAAEARMTGAIFVCKGKASEILDIEPEFEKLPSVELSKILKDQKITSHSPIVTEFDFVTDMLSQTTSPVAPLVRVIDDEGKTRLNVAGTAVFKGSRMVGEFDESQTRGLLFVLNKVKTGVMKLTVTDTPATIEIRQANSKVTPILYTDGSSRFNVEVNATVGIGDQSGTLNLADPDRTGAMLGAAETAIKGEITSAVNKSTELDADVFGFGEYLNRKYPDQWKELQKNWDKLYKNIKVDVTVKARADGSGRIDKPLAPKGD